MVSQPTVQNGNWGAVFVRPEITFFPSRYFALRDRGFGIHGRFNDTPIIKILIVVAFGGQIVQNSSFTPGKTNDYCSNCQKKINFTKWVKQREKCKEDDFRDGAVISSYRCWNAVILITNIVVYRHVWRANLKLFTSALEAILPVGFDFIFRRIGSTKYKYFASRWTWSQLKREWMKVACHVPTSLGS